MEVKRQLTRLAAGSAIIAAAAFASVGLAQADGMPSQGRVVYESPSNWSGLYFGVQSGWQWSSIDQTFTAPLPNSVSFGHDSQTVGGQIGLQHQFGLIVVGVEADLSSAFREHEAVENCPVNPPGVKCHARFEDVLTVGGRLGYAMGKWMPYVAGGYANGAFQTSGVNTLGAEFDQDHSRHNGWYIGGGVDMAMSHGWTIGLEYRHYEFDNAFHLAFTPAGAAVALDSSVVGASSDAITMRVSWKLGRPEAVVPLK